MKDVLTFNEAAEYTRAKQVVFVQIDQHTADTVLQTHGQMLIF